MKRERCMCHCSPCIRGSCSACTEAGGWCAAPNAAPVAEGPTILRGPRRFLIETALALGAIAAMGWIGLALHDALHAPHTYGPWQVGRCRVDEFRGYRDVQCEPLPDAGAP